MNLTVALLAGVVTCSVGQPAMAGRMVEPSLAHLGFAEWSSAPAEQALLRGCSLPSEPAVLAVTVDPPSRREVAHCLATGRRTALIASIGYEAAYLVAQKGDWLDLGAREFYLSTAAMVPSQDGRGLVANPNRRWRDVRSDLPDAPIRILLPLPSQAPHSLFARSVLEPGCFGAPVIRAIFDANDRVRRCTTVRDDGPVMLAALDSDPLAWLRGQAPFAVIVVGQSDVARLGDDQVVLPMAGVVPTYSSVSGGAYPASWTVTLTVVGSAAAGDMLQTAAELVSERSIGPGGSMVAAGLTPLPPGDRVALRAKLFMLEGW